jgi:hypothetical protein
VAASTNAIFALAAVIIVVAIVAQYLMPQAGRRKRPPRS